MDAIFQWLFSSAGFMPHGQCYLWQPGVLWLNVVSDAVIAGAYYAIPFTIYHFVRRRGSEIPYPWVLLMFAAFIFLCGTTHLMEIWTVWNPQYRLAGVLKLVTGAVSVATMLALLRVVPHAMLLRTPSELRLEVDARTAELAQLNAKLREEIGARDIAQAKLREQDRRKDEFLATLAHELRNPLAPIRHAVKLLGVADADQERQRWGREVIGRQAQRMALLLDDLLDVARITRGRLELKTERVELATVLNAAVETVRPLVEEKQHVLTIDAPDQGAEIDVDPLRLSQAISNVLANAAKFTPAGGRIGLTARISPDGLEIVVSDNGIGFAPEATSHLFEMFARSDAGGTASEGGLGIGLSLVKGLIELHGGSIEARSKGLGLGSEFALRLPASVVAARPLALVADPLAASSARAGCKVLVADDNRDSADTLGLLLELAGHDVLVAHSGREALDMGRLHRPDVVILDIGMPDLDGYEVARFIRNESWGQNALLLAITGWGQENDKDRAHAAGFDRHLTKPVNPDTVEELLRIFLAAARAPAPDV
jgi:signal transduction histidine kinase/ActR/RegA family two-component response regulator